MTERISAICGRLPRAKKFADVGCDHGYCTQYMLQNGLCETACVSDISKGSLLKAETLLQEEINGGRCVAICADGMKGLPPDCDLVLIAGLGGAEIVRVLGEGYLPENMVLQPMKDAPMLRKFLIERGCRITSDETFYAEKKYYDIITAQNAGGTSYTDWEIKFGRDNLLNPSEAFFGKMRHEKRKLKGYLSRRMSEKSREGVTQRLREIEVILNAIEADL